MLVSRAGRTCKQPEYGSRSHAQTTAHGREASTLPDRFMLTLQAHTLAGTVAAMYRLMQQYIPDVWNQGWRSVPEVFDGVKQVPYRRDETASECGGAGECVKRPGLTLALGGDCDDKVVLAGAALAALGVPHRIVTTSYRPDGAMQHTYLEILANGDWLPFDATYPYNQLFVEAPYTRKEVWQ